MHVAVATEINSRLIAKLKQLHTSLQAKTNEFSDIVKIGRTHTQDATSLNLGQEFSGYTTQVKFGTERIICTLPRYQLAQGGTVVGTVLNIKKGLKAADMQRETEQWRKAAKAVASVLDGGEVIYSKTAELESLVLYYSNRASKRMSLRKMRKALDDCRIAARLDPSFLKVCLTAGNCHLELGELDDALYNYKKCLESRVFCLDRRFTIEASVGVHKLEKVGSYIKQAVELLRQKTSESATNALEIVMKALSISCFLENLLKMRAEGLFLDEADGSNEYNNFQRGSFNTTKQLIEDLENIDIVFHIGDICYANGYLSQWDQFTSQIEPIASTVPYMIVRNWIRPLIMVFYSPRPEV